MTHSLSHADFVTGAVLLRIAGTEDFARVWKRADGTTDTEAYKRDAVRLVFSRYRSLLAHEWAHTLQVATYPYLFLRAARQGRVMSGISQHLEAHPGHYPLPLPFSMTHDWAQSNMLSEVPVRVTFQDEGIQMAPVPLGNRITRGVLTELDLIEEDAQIFQYRAEIGARGNGTAYRRWLTERPRYSRAFLLAARHLGNEVAYRVFPLLVRLAFGTTRPLQAFLKALGHVLANDLAFISDWDELPVLERILLRDLVDHLGEARDDELTMFQPEIKDGPGVISAGQRERLIAGGRQLPIAPLADIDVHGSESLPAGAVGDFLARPWEQLPRRREPTERAFALLPPALVIQLVDRGFPAGSTVVFLSPLLLRTPFAGIPGTTYGDWFIELYRGRMVWKAVLGGAAGPHPTCTFTDCRMHGTGLCHGWFPVPKRLEDCQFPYFFRTTTKHDVSPDGAGLVPAATTGARDRGN